MDDTSIIFSPSDTQIAACIPGKACLLQDLYITVDNPTVSPSQDAKNLGVTLDNTLSFFANIEAVTTGSCSTTYVEYDPTSHRMQHRS